MTAPLLKHKRPPAYATNLAFATNSGHLPFEA